MVSANLFHTVGEEFHTPILLVSLTLILGVDVTVVAVLQRRLENANVKVILNTEVTPEYVRQFDPDALFVAIGSNELRPPIPGMELPHVLMAIDAELHPEKLGKAFVIEADSVVCALGFRAPYDMVDALCAEVDECYIIGDCANVGQIYHAINQAYYAAMRV